LQMWNNIKIIGRRFRKVTNMNVAFRWISPYFQFFLFEWRLADWPWNVVILLGFQVPVPCLDLIFGIFDTFRCETTLNFFADDSGKLWKWSYHLVDFDRFWSFSCLTDVSPTDLGMLSFCWDFKFRCPFLIWFSESATLVDVKQHQNFLPMIPENYENDHIIWLILTAFEVFLVWVTFPRLTLECCHSAGISSSGALFWFDFRNLPHL